METTITGLGFRGVLGLYGDNGKEMETPIMGLGFRQNGSLQCNIVIESQDPFPPSIYLTRGKG